MILTEEATQAEDPVAMMATDPTRDPLRATSLSAWTSPPAWATSATPTALDKVMRDETVAVAVAAAGVPMAEVVADIRKSFRLSASF